MLEVDFGGYAVLRRGEDVERAPVLVMRTLASCRAMRVDLDEPEPDDPSRFAGWTISDLLGRGRLDVEARSNDRFSKGATT